MSAIGAAKFNASQCRRAAFRREWDVIILLLVAIGFGSGCSDPADQMLKQKLVWRAKAADRLVISASGEYADPTFKSVEIKGPEKLSQFLTTVEFSAKRKFVHPHLGGPYEIQFFSNDQKLVTLTFKQGAFLSWQTANSSNEVGILQADSCRLVLAWLATNGCDIVQRERDAQTAREERRRRAEQDCVNCFPPEVRGLFADPGYGVEVRPWALERGKHLAKSIGNPVKLTAMTCQAFGCLDEYWGMTIVHEAILNAAMNTATGADFVNALKEIAGDRRALLGAGRIFFGEGYRDRGYS